MDSTQLIKSERKVAELKNRYSAQQSSFNVDFLSTNDLLFRVKFKLWHYVLTVHKTEHMDVSLLLFKRHITHCFPWGQLGFPVGSAFPY